MQLLSTFLGEIGYLKNAKIKSVTLTFFYMENFNQCKLVVYSDASYNNLENNLAYFDRIVMEIYPLIMWQYEKLC